MLQSPAMIHRLLKTRELGILAVLGLELVIFAVLLHRPGQPNLFLSSTSQLAAIEESAILGLAAIGSCLVIISGGIDLSVGSQIALVTVVTARLLSPEVGWPVPLAVLAGLLCGAACGWLAAALICRAKLPPFIVTLGLMSVIRGTAFLLTGGTTIPVDRQSPLLTVIGDGAVNVGGVAIPALVIVLVATAAGFTWLLARTTFGRGVYALGGNEEAARLSGVRVVRLKHLVYTLAGLCAGLSGCAYVAAHGAGQSTAATGWELDAIAAAVLGGASLSGGRGSVVGACVGALIFRLLLKGLTMLGASRYQMVIIGLVVIVAVVVDQVTTARARGAAQPGR